MQFFTVKILLLAAIFSSTSCSNNEQIEIIKERELIPDPDKELRKKSETRSTLLKIDDQISTSDSIEICQSGQKLINSGLEILPFLQVEFKDSTETKIYSEYNKRNLTIGEVAIIIANSIKQIPIFQVIGVEQCIPPFERDVEKFLDAIKYRPERFYQEYANWIDTLK